MAIREELVGLLKVAVIEDFDESSGEVYITFPNSQSTVTWGQSTRTTIPIPYPLAYSNGFFIGCKPKIKDQIIVAQGTTNTYYFVSFLDTNPKLEKPSDDELLIRVSDSSKIKLNSLQDTIKMGSENYNINVVNTNNYGDSGVLISNFKNSYLFTHATRKTVGVIKRDKERNPIIDDFSKLSSESYESELSEIGLDPKSSVFIGNSTYKNPPLVENRELVYEFSPEANVSDDLSEAQIYGKSQSIEKKNYTRQNRRLAKTDTLSLSLYAPNHLMETVKGTVVDIFGNILDLNRQPIGVGSENLTLKDEETKKDDKSKIFNDIKALHRKAMAFHFEINAKKDLFGNNNKIQLPDLNSKDDYARSRSRFFIDIDKEGQFKLNVPASSESGNIPLLARYENFSTFSPEDDGNPNKLIESEDGKDIYLDGFASDAYRKKAIFAGAAGKSPGTIEIIDGDKPATPLDRIDNVHIKHGTAYHDILDTCWLHKDGNQMYFDYQTAGQETIDFASIPKLEASAADKIYISGDKKNAGGRSGQANFDGLIELNIGASTADRQSMWLDFAGGIVGNIGKDLRNNSALLSMDGNLMLQIGTTTGITSDSRFIKSSNEVQGGVLDIRVFRQGGFAHMIRIDDNGVSVMTGGQLRMFSKGNMILRSDSSIKMDAPQVFIQDRMVAKYPPVSI
jgi:hypothetical protein